MKKESAELPGVGTFVVIHQRSADEKTGKQTRSRNPPKDIIQFTPEATL